MTRLKKLPVKISAGLGLSMVDRAVKEWFSERCAADDLAAVYAYFKVNGGDYCFYCDAPEPTRWDHLHAVSRGGSTVPGNLVPACGRCDDSKQARDVEEWIASKSRHRPSGERLQVLLGKIRAYREHFHYQPVAFEKRLSPSQREVYTRLRVEIDTLRTHLQAAGVLQETKRRTQQ